MLLAGGTVADWRDDYYVETITHVSSIEQRAIRTRDWKLIVSENGSHELYDLAADPEEELDVFLTPRPDIFERFRHYPDYAPVIAGLADRMAAWASRIDDARGQQLVAALRDQIAPRLRRKPGPVTG